MQKKMSWSELNSFDLKAGTYKIKVYYPHIIFMIPVCVAKAEINLEEADIIVLKYKLPFLEFLPGHLIVVSSDKKVNLSDSKAANTDLLKIPDYCPNCKSPNNKRISICEWCGHHIY
jgi:hypothetical protein